jgi:hypothetical protein
MSIIHLTHTGQFAGIPFCGCNRNDPSQIDNTFMHVPYGAEQDKFFNNPFKPICKECLAIWDGAGEEE